MRAEYNNLPEECVLPLSCSKITPGERCSCDTTTRSVPLITNVPTSVISGNSPIKTSCSRISLMGLTSPGTSLSKTTKRILTRKGAE